MKYLATGTVCTCVISALFVTMYTVVEKQEKLPSSLCTLVGRTTSSPTVHTATILAAALQVGFFISICIQYRAIVHELTKPSDLGCHKNKSNQKSSLSLCCHLCCICGYENLSHTLVSWEHNLNHSSELHDKPSHLFINSISEEVRVKQAQHEITEHYFCIFCWKRHKNTDNKMPILTSLLFIVFQIIALFLWSFDFCFLYLCSQ